MSGQITALQGLLRNKDYLQVNEIDILKTSVFQFRHNNY